MTKGISIIIPCYNEENNLKRGVLKEVSEYLKTVKYPHEVIVSNDKSTDNSLKLLKEHAQKDSKFSIFDLPQKGGKPGGLWYGIQKAKYPWCLMTDIDQSTPLVELEKLTPHFSDYDVVIGSRGTHRQGNSLIRKIGANVFLRIRRLFLLPDIIDTQCGFKAIKTEVAKKVFPHLNAIKMISGPGWRVTAYDVEMLFLAQKFGYKIKEVPVKWQDEDTSTTKGDFATRYRKESIQMAKEIYRVKSNDLKGVYDQA
ncbi:MAG: glycosyltransferase [Candidatus Shapirobacteria bacterium]|jgi:dolichyl-phosphate beta-glucosyltransferase